MEALPEGRYCLAHDPDDPRPDECVCGPEGAVAEELVGFIVNAAGDYARAGAPRGHVPPLDAHDHFRRVVRDEVLRALAARAREAEGFVSELRQARADYWEVQAALTEIKLLVPLDESTDGPKAGWAGVVERVRCFTQRAEREAADLREKAEESERGMAYALALVRDDLQSAQKDARTLHARCERLEGAVAAANRLLGASEVGEPVPDDEWARVRSVLYDALHHPAPARAAEPAGEDR